jgi:hypothetical protein
VGGTDHGRGTIGAGAPGEGGSEMKRAMRRSRGGAHWSMGSGGEAARLWHRAALASAWSEGKVESEGARERGEMVR